MANKKYYAGGPFNPRVGAKWPWWAIYPKLKKHNW